MTQTISIRDVRNNLAEIINRVAIAGDSFIITKFGKPQAMITSTPAKASKDELKAALDATFGIWKDRKDITNPAAYVRKRRHQMSSRFPIAKPQ